MTEGFTVHLERSRAWINIPDPRPHPDKDSHTITISGDDFTVGIIAQALRDQERFRAALVCLQQTIAAQVRIEGNTFLVTPAGGFPAVAADDYIECTLAPQEPPCPIQH